MRITHHEKAQAATVGLLALTKDRELYSCATASFITPRLLITALPMLASLQRSVLLEIISFDEQRHSVRVAHTDRKANVALLKLMKGEPSSQTHLSLSARLPEKDWRIRMYGFDYSGAGLTCKAGSFEFAADGCQCGDPQCAMHYGGCAFSLFHRLQNIAGWLGAPIVDAYTGKILSLAWGCPAEDQEEDQEQVIGPHLAGLKRFLRRVL